MSNHSLHAKHAEQETPKERPPRDNIQKLQKICILEERAKLTRTGGDKKTDIPAYADMHACTWTATDGCGVRSGLGSRYAERKAKTLCLCLAVDRMIEDKSLSLHGDD